MISADRNLMPGAYGGRMLNLGKGALWRAHLFFVVVSFCFSPCCGAADLVFAPSPQQRKEIKVAVSKANSLVAMLLRRVLEVCRNESGTITCELDSDGKRLIQKHVLALKGIHTALFASEFDRLEAYVFSIMRFMYFVHHELAYYTEAHNNEFELSMTSISKILGLAYPQPASGAGDQTRDIFDRVAEVDPAEREATSLVNFKYALAGDSFKTKHLEVDAGGAYRFNPDDVDEAQDALLLKNYLTSLRFLTLKMDQLRNILTPHTNADGSGDDSTVRSLSPISDADLSTLSDASTIGYDEEDRSGRDSVISAGSGSYSHAAAGAASGGSSSGRYYTPSDIRDRKEAFISYLVSLTPGSPVLRRLRNAFSDLKLRMHDLKTAFATKKDFCSTFEERLLGAFWTRDEAARHEYVETAAHNLTSCSSSLSAALVGGALNTTVVDELLNQFFRSLVSLHKVVALYRLSLSSAERSANDAFDRYLAVAGFAYERTLDALHSSLGSFTLYSDSAWTLATLISSYKSLAPGSSDALERSVYTHALGLPTESVIVIDGNHKAIADTICQLIEKACPMIERLARVIETIFT